MRSPQRTNLKIELSFLYSLCIKTAWGSVCMSRMFIWMLSCALFSRINIKNTRKWNIFPPIYCVLIKFPKLLNVFNNNTCLYLLATYVKTRITAIWFSTSAILSGCSFHAWVQGMFVSDVMKYDESRGQWNWPFTSKI